MIHRGHRVLPSPRSDCKLLHTPGGEQSGTHCVHLQYGPVLDAERMQRLPA